MSPMAGRPGAEPRIRILRGRVLTFIEEPQTRDDQASYRYFEDGLVAIDVIEGDILAVGPWGDGPKWYDGTPPEIIDHRPNLILPGFIDTHIHFPQMQVIGAYAAALLEWLNTYTFVEEQRFADFAHAKRIASRFFDELIRHGTTTAAAYCSVHPQSVDAFFEEAEARDMLMVAGKVMMDRNAPCLLYTSPSPRD